MSWGAFLAAIGKALAAGLQWLLNRQQLEAGRNAERADVASQNAETQRQANEARAPVDSADSAELERLQRRWTRE